MNKVEILAQLQALIERDWSSYTPPDGLSDRLSAEYRNYVNSPGYYRWLALSIRHMRPHAVLELGTLFGVSASMIFSELRPDYRYFVSCDVQQHPQCRLEQMQSDPRVRFVVGDDLDLSIYDEIPTEIDYLFIDTVHTFEHLSKEWAIYQHLCAAGAIVVLDDISMADTPQFWNDLPFEKLDLSNECHASGFGAFIYSPPSDQRQMSVSERVALARNVSNDLK